MKKTLIICLLLSNVAFSTDLKGKLQGFNSNTRVYYPIDRTTVEIGNYDNARRWVRTAISVTDRNGMYYFYRINPGIYVVRYGNIERRITVQNTSLQEIPIENGGTPNMMLRRIFSTT